MATIVNCITSGSGYKYKFLISETTKTTAFGTKSNILGKSQTCYITLDTLLDGIVLTDGTSKDKHYKFWTGELEAPFDLSKFTYEEKIETYIKDDEQVSKTVFIITGSK